MSIFFWNIGVSKKYLKQMFKKLGKKDINITYRYIYKYKLV